MATINAYNYFVANIDGRRYEAGSLSNPIAIATDGETHERKKTVGTETTLKLFDVDADLSDFDFLWIDSDFDVMLELVTDDDADVGEESFTVPLKGSGVANKYGLAFQLARDDSYANYTVNFGGGTLDNIETIRVRNLSATQAAEVRCFAFT